MVSMMIITPWIEQSNETFISIIFVFKNSQIRDIVTFFTFRVWKYQPSEIFYKHIISGTFLGQRDEILWYLKQNEKGTVWNKHSQKFWISEFDDNWFWILSMKLGFLCLTKS